MHVDATKARSIFLSAVENYSPDQWGMFLDEACHSDVELRRRVELLLRAHQGKDSVLDRGDDDDVGTTIDRPDITEGPGTKIGPYKLMEQIGEGGFGLVFVAEQHRPIRRKVALKIIKPGMDTRDVIARFEAERQALAMMDHPNIARVFDAGTTDSGRPYFVMELVRGVPITEYCDQHHLTSEERLELFISVCYAIQHAHQKGIIHRDVKPTNVLVTRHDGVPVVKVIDFGVAKALSQQLTERTIYTQFAQMLGTPLYMSPEQAEMSGLDIDTRSDIYSLGVLLYELLTGTTPFERQRFSKAAVDEIRRILCEEEPPKPSTRLTQSGDRLASIAAQRNTEPAKLARLVRGDLDWIAMKCLEKDRNRRYETANGLARDIERFLRDEPITARPPSAMYQFSKFARRNKAALLMGSAVIVTLLLLVAGLAISNRIIAAERNQKAAALREREAALALADAQRQRAEENFRKARTAVRGILTQAAMGSGEWSQLPPSVREKFTQETVNFYNGFVEQESSDPSLQHERAVAYRALSEVHKRLGKPLDAKKFIHESINILERLTAEYPRNFDYRQQLAWSHYVLATLNRSSHHNEAQASLERAVKLYEALITESPDNAECLLEALTCYADLVTIQHVQKALEQVELTSARMVELAARVPDTSSAAPDVLAYAGTRLSKAGRSREAVATWREAIRLKSDNANGYNQVAWYLATCPDVQSRDSRRAVELASKAVKLAPTFGNAWNTLGVAQYRAGDWKAAIDALNKSIELRHGGDASDWFFLAMAEWQLGNKAAAREWKGKAVDWMEKHSPKDEELIRFRTECAELLGLSEAEKNQPVSASDETMTTQVHLSKPVDPHDLTAVIASLAGRTGPAA